MDFTTFVITGPSTLTTTVGKVVGGQIGKYSYLKKRGCVTHIINLCLHIGATGKAASLKTTCATDQFEISNSPSVPTLCGTLTGDHGMIFWGGGHTGGNLFYKFQSGFFVKSLI